MARKKFGLRRVRPPKSVVEELHYEHRAKKGVRGPDALLRKANRKASFRHLPLRGLPLQRARRAHHLLAQPSFQSPPLPAQAAQRAAGRATAGPGLAAGHARARARAAADRQRTVAPQLASFREVPSQMRKGGDRPSSLQRSTT